MTNSQNIIQRYRAIIPSIDLTEDSYYIFLVDSAIAMSSSNFRSRLESDEKFTEMIKTRVAAGTPV
jgi:hypothetical protein